MAGATKRKAELLLSTEPGPSPKRQRVAVGDVFKLGKWVGEQGIDESMSEAGMRMLKDGRSLQEVKNGEWEK